MSTLIHVEAEAGACVFVTSTSARARAHVLASIDADRLSGRPPGVPMPAMAVAYYPGCAETMRSARVVGVPLLMQLGQADDWTPAQPCIDWAHRASR